MKAYIRRDDPLLVGLSEKPEGFSPAIHANWLKRSVKAKSNITLSLSDAAMSRTRLIVDDDDASANDLWDEINNLYTETNAQAVQNLKNELDALVYKDGADWNTNVTSFLATAGKLASFDVELTEKDKVSRFIRSLPVSFSPLAMVPHLTDAFFNNIVNAVQAEIARRSNPHNPQSTSTPTAKLSQSKAGNASGRKSRRNKKQNLQGGVKKNTRRDNCYYCGKLGHYCNVCRKSIADQRNSQGQHGGNERRSRFGQRNVGPSNNWGSVNRNNN